MKKLKELYKFLFVIEADKGAHFWLGGWISMFIMLTLYRLPILFTDISVFWSKLIAFGGSMLLLFIITLLKEKYDVKYKKGLFNWKDIMWGMIGGVFMTLILIFFM